MSRLLDIRLLGDLDLRLGEERAAAARVRPRGVAARLPAAAPRRGAAAPAPRVPALADSTEPQARTNLRHVLHTLRRALPDADRSRRQAADAPVARRRAVWLDVAVFEQALADGRLTRPPSRRTPATCSRAATTSGCSRSASGCATLHLDALERLAAGRTSAATRPRRSATRSGSSARDPLREDDLPAADALHDARGDRARALRAYHACAATLAARARHRAVGGDARGLRGAAAGALRRRPPTARAPPLVGRRRSGPG